jgi:hypothetical protein
VQRLLVRTDARGRKVEVTEYDLAERLKNVWAKYALKRSAEEQSIRLYETAEEELRTLNARRVKAGLPPVGMHPGLQQMVQNAQGFQFSPPLKTWRDDMNDELLAVCRTYLVQS